jgi:hypothetical protein
MGQFMGQEAVQVGRRLSRFQPQHDEPAVAVGCPRQPGRQRVLERAGNLLREAGCQKEKIDLDLVLQAEVVPDAPVEGFGSGGNPAGEGRLTGSVVDRDRTEAGEGPALPGRIGRVGGGGRQHMNRAENYRRQKGPEQRSRRLSSEQFPPSSPLLPERHNRRRGYGQPVGTFGKMDQG